MKTAVASLWEKIQAFRLDEAAVSFPFSRRLMRENDWDEAYTYRVMEEYKKFVLLMCVVGHPVTPSDEVDQVWHLHLLYTRSYWEDLCENTLGQRLHHGPTKGGAAEGNKFNDWYARTLQSYREIFGEEPPVDIWRPAKIRFGEVNFQRVNMHRNWVVRKPTYSKWALSAAPLLLLPVVLLGEIDFTTVGLSMFIGGVALAFIFILMGERRTRLKKKQQRLKQKNRKKSHPSGSSTTVIGTGGDGVSGGGDAGSSSADSFGGGDFGGAGSTGDSGCGGSGCSSGCGGGGCGGCGG
jgi:hypothetical protein